MLRLSAPGDLLHELVALRADMTEPGIELASMGIDFARAYAALAVRLNNPRAAEGEAAALRGRLEDRRIGEMAAPVALGYAAVVSRLTDPASRRRAVKFLRTKLEHEQDSLVAAEFAKAYATVASRLTNPADIKADAAAILTLAGHPMILEPAPLVDALQPASGVMLNGDLGAALRWAEQSYGVRPEQLRPPSRRADRARV